MPIGTSKVGSVAERFQHILLEVAGGSEFLLRLLWNMGVLRGRFQAAINLGEVIFLEVALRILWRPKEGQATTSNQEADIVTGVDIVRGVRDQDNGVSLIGKFAQQEHHFAVQAGIKTRGW